MSFFEDTLAAPRPDAVAALGLPRRQHYHPSPASWQDKVFYFLLVDRFSDGAENTRPLLDRPPLPAGPGSAEVPGVGGDGLDHQLPGFGPFGTAGSHSNGSASRGADVLVNAQLNLPGVDRYHELLGGGRSSRHNAPDRQPTTGTPYGLGRCVCRNSGCRSKRGAGAPNRP